jgi:carboxypeptidase family protein
MFVRLTRSLRDKLSIVCGTSLTLFLCVTLSTLLASGAWAQDAVGALEGIVGDSNSRPIVGATLTLQNLETNSVRTQTSNEEGRYRFTPLSVGRYSLATEAAGFAHFYGENSTYHAAQVSFSRGYTNGLSFNISYWLSQTLDYLSSMNLQGSSAKPLSGENDLAQNPFDLNAEHGPSLFDARHRFVASVTWEIPFAKKSQGLTKRLLDGWQLNGIANANSATPFTVYDSNNVSLQASAPPISGYFASRPNLIGNPSHGPHSVTQWLDRSSFQRLDPQAQAGQFGNESRNASRGPALPMWISLRSRHLSWPKSSICNSKRNPLTLQTIRISNCQSPTSPRLISEESLRPAPHD